MKVHEAWHRKSNLHEKPKEKLETSEEEKEETLEKAYEKSNETLKNIICEKEKYEI